MFPFLREFSGRKVDNIYIVMYVIDEINRSDGRNMQQHEISDSGDRSTKEMARKKISTTIYITEEQNERLKQLNRKTKVPVAEYIRQGIDLILEQNKNQLPGQLTF